MVCVRVNAFLYHLIMHCMLQCWYITLCSNYYSIIVRVKYIGLVWSDLVVKGSFKTVCYTGILYDLYHSYIPVEAKVSKVG